MTRPNPLWAALGAVALYFVFVSGCHPPAFAQEAASQGYVPGGSTQPIGFDQITWCQGGTEPGSECSVDGDCAGGGTCHVVWVQTSAMMVPSWALTRNEQRTVGTSAVNAFSTTAEPCWSVRIKNIGSTTLYVGWSGVTTSSGVPILPGEYGPPMYPPGRDCNAVKLVGDAVNGSAAVVTP